jgi:hypothetical protein
VALAVATRAARRELSAGAEVAYFRSLGRSYGPVGGAALAVALLMGAAFLSQRGWDSGAALAERVVRGSRRAVALRGTIAVLTLALLALGSWLAS